MTTALGAEPSASTSSVHSEERAPILDPPDTGLPGHGAARPPRRLISNALRNVASGWAVLIVNTTASLVISPLVVNGLGSVYYGVWTLLMQFSGYLWLFDFGVRDSVVKFVAQYHAVDDKPRLQATIRTAITLYGIVTLAAAAAVGLGVLALPYVFNIPDYAMSSAKIAALLSGGNVAQSFLSNVFIGVLVGLQRTYLVSIVSLGHAIIRAFGTVALLSYGFGIVGLAAMYLALSVVHAAIVVRLCAWQLPGVLLRPARLRWPDVRPLLNFGKYVLLANVGDKIVFATDAVVIGAFLPIAALTPYAIAGSLSEHVRAFVRSMGGVFSPITSGLRAMRDEDALQRVVLSGAKGAMLVGLPFCIGLIVVGRLFVELWMGPAHAETAGRVMIVLAAGFAIGAPYYIIAGTMYGLGSHRRVALLRIAEGIANLSLSIALIKTVGVVGVALGTMIPHVIIVGLVMPRILRAELGIDLGQYYRTVYVRPLLAATPFVATLLYVERMFRFGGLSMFVAAVAASTATYFVPAWMFALSGEDRARILKAGQRMLSRGDIT